VNITELVSNWPLFCAVLAGLILFGVIYNRKVQELGDDKEGHLSLYVAFGVFVTLVGVFFIDQRAAVIALICFIASGTPMIIGDLSLDARTRRNEREREREEAKQLARKVLDDAGEDE
jgi:hypothetical membrane protein